MINIFIKKLEEEAVIPSYAKKGDAGMDLTATSMHVDFKENIITYGTGISIAIPDGYAGFIFPRSSIYKTGLTLCNSVGVVDSGYRGEILVKFSIFDTRRYQYEIGDRIAQLVVLPCPKITFVITDLDLPISERGEAGFGSSGR